MNGQVIQWFLVVHLELINIITVLLYISWSKFEVIFVTKKLFKQLLC